MTKSYYKAQKSKKQLNKEFDIHLEKLKKICDLQKSRKENLKKELKRFKGFLLENLKDPYMVYSLKLKFEDISHLMHEDFNNSSTAFSLSYRRLYNLPENTKPENYPDTWAKVIYQALKCTELKPKIL